MSINHAPRAPRRSGTVSGNQPDPIILETERFWRCGRRPALTLRGDTKWAPGQVYEGVEGEGEGSGGVSTETGSMLEVRERELRIRAYQIKIHVADRLFRAEREEERLEAMIRASSYLKPEPPKPAPLHSSPHLSCWSSSSSSGSSSAASTPSHSPLTSTFPPYKADEDRQIYDDFDSREYCTVPTSLRPCPPLSSSPAPSPTSYRPRRRVRWARDDGLVQIRVYEQEGSSGEELWDYFPRWDEEDKDDILAAQDSSDDDDLEPPDAGPNGIPLPSAPSPPTSTPTPSSSPGLGAAAPSDALTSVSVVIAALKLEGTLTPTSESSAAATDLLAGASITPADSSSSPSPIPSPHTGTSTSTPDATQPLEDFEGTPVLTSCQAPEATVDEEWPSAMGAPAPPANFFKVESKETPATVTDFVVA